MQVIFTLIQEHERSMIKELNKIIKEIKTRNNFDKLVHRYGDDTATRAIFEKV